MKKNYIIIIAMIIFIGIIINIKSNIELNYKYVGTDNNNISMISDGKKYGYYNLKQKKEIVPIIYELPFKLENGDKTILETKYNIFPITSKDKNGKIIYGLASIDNKVLIKPKYSEVIITSKNTIIAKNDKYQFVDIKGNNLNEKKYQEIVEISNSKLLISYNENKYGLVDTSSKEILKNKYNEIDYYITDKDILFQALSENSTEYYLYDKKTDNFKPLQIKDNIEIKNYNENIITYKKNNRYYLYNTKTNKNIKLGNYSSVGKFNSSLAYYIHQEKIGFIDKNGKEIIKAQYDNKPNSNFIDSIASVNKNNKTLIIDKKGNKLLKTNYDTLTILNSNRIIASEKNEDYLIDINNKKLTKEKYNLIQKIENSKYLITYLKKDNNIYCGLIDYNGKVIEKNEYLEIKYSKNYYYLKTKDKKYIIKKIV